MEPERVSVIIPAFRRAGPVVEAIRSALEQTHPVHEVIVVDDASGDGTAAAVQALTDSRIKLIVLPANGGQSAATNRGIDAAMGELIALLDSDDLWLPDKLEVQLAAWRAHPRRDEMLFSSRVLVEVDGRRTATIPAVPIREHEAIDDYLFVRGGFIQSSTFLLSRTLAAAVRFDETTRRHSDLTFLLRLGARGGGVVQIGTAPTRWRSSSAVARLSTSANLQASLEWFAKYRPLMSSRAAIGFRYRNHIRILRRDAPLAAALLTLRAVAAGVLGWRDVRRKLAPAAARLRRNESAPR